MFCPNCGAQSAEEAVFCRECGAPVQSRAQAQPAPPSAGPAAPAYTPPPAFPAPPPRFAPPAPRGGGPSRNVWVILASVAIVVIALAIALPLVFVRGGDAKTVETVSISSTTVTTAPSTTTSAAPATTTSTEPPTTETTEAPSTTTTSEAAAASIPGDSAGTWAETQISGLGRSVNQVAVSDDALLFEAENQEGTTGIYAYLFATKKTVQLPTSAETAGEIDIDGTLAVWWEANGGDEITDAHIYAYRLPDGPKVEVASGTTVGWPQVAGNVVTWLEGKPWATEPDEWWENTIKSVTVDQMGQPTGPSLTLVDSAIASRTGDATWTYSLSDGYVAWEEQSDAGPRPAGSYMMDLGALQPWHIDPDAWRPSLIKNWAVFTRNGIEVTQFERNDAGHIDDAGDFATAAPTYVAYFRPTASGNGTAWAVVAKGFNGMHEQVLLDDTGDPPWFLSPIAASANHIVFVLGDGTLHLFTWQGE
jgi:hypothetical protein